MMFVRTGIGRRRNSSQLRRAAQETWLEDGNTRRPLRSEVSKHGAGTSLVHLITLTLNHVVDRAVFRMLRCASSDDM